jgi:hypothetical protein
LDRRESREHASLSDDRSRPTVGVCSLLAGAELVDGIAFKLIPHHTIGFEEDL